MHPLKRIESKSLPGYFMYAEGIFGRISQHHDHALEVVSPGMTGKIGTVSLQTFDKKWLIDNSSKIEVAPYDRTLRFKYMATFNITENKWFPGYMVLESCMKSGHFLRNDGEWLRMDAFEDSVLFKNSSSWRVTERGKIYLRSGFAFKF